jgi:hypothetical protein
MGEDTRLRQYDISWKVVGLIPDEVIIFFNGVNPFSRTMILGSTQPLTESGLYKGHAGLSSQVRREK